jgi:hypothetical protein
MNGEDSSYNSLDTDNISVELSDEDPNNPLTPRTRARKILEKQKEKKKQMLIERGLYVS